MRNINKISQFLILAVLLFASCDSGGNKDTNRQATSPINKYISEMENIKKNVKNKDTEQYKILEQMHTRLLKIKQGLDVGRHILTKSQAEVILGRAENFVNSYKIDLNVSEGQIDKLNSAKIGFLETL